MIIVAVDPGIKGAIAFFDPDRPNRVDVFDLPSAAGAIDGRNLCALVKRFNPDRAALELVHSMPKQGVASMFKFGRCFGTVIGILEALGLPIVYMPPSTWKRHYGLNSDGEKSRRLALDLFPESAAEFVRKLDHHRAEAALIARLAATDPKGSWRFEQDASAPPRSSAATTSKSLPHG